MRIGDTLAYQAGKVDPYWTSGETKRWPGRAMAAVERGARTSRKDAKAQRQAGKAEKRTALIAQRVALGING